MEITEVRVILVNQPDSRLKAICSISIDHEFVIWDIKVVMNSNGLTVVMPNQMIKDHCPKCRSNNTLSSKFCGQCGCKLPDKQGPKDKYGRIQLFTDIAHPITTQCRDLINQRILEAYESELNKSGRIDYQPAEINNHLSEYSGGAERA